MILACPEARPLLFLRLDSGARARSEGEIAFWELSLISLLSTSSWNISRHPVCSWVRSIVDQVFMTIIHRFSWFCLGS